MIQLTEDQRKLVQEGNAIPVRDNGDDFVLIRRDLFEQLQRAEYDRSSWSADDLDLVREESVGLLDQFGKLP
ncbi:MAG: hypothetical protein IT422_08785 [Pirellulaceae bacterium]|jgi:hypothetical protein|nr:hypothetical protein [Planctomycetales bacterium]MCC7335180.1 hypothetical protein [Pirellulaceae bacterium]